MTQLAILANDERLSTILKDKMNTDEQQLFVQSFKMYLEHGSDEKTFVVDYDDVWQWMGFPRKDHGKRLLVKEFIENVDYIVENSLPNSGERVSPADNDANVSQHGGQNKEAIFLTVTAFKNFCMRANTSKAEVIRGYYVKMETILHDYTLQCLQESNIKMLEAQASASHERHHALLAGYVKKRLVYVLRLMDAPNNAGFIIRIGSTDNLRDRVNHHNTTYKLKVKVLDVFACENHTGFEKFLHHHAKLVSRRYRDPINDVNSIETYLMPDEAVYKKIKHVMESGVHKYAQLNHDDPFHVREHELKMQTLKNQELQHQLELQRLKNEELKLRLSEPYITHTEPLKKQCETLIDYLKVFIESPTTIPQHPSVLETIPATAINTPQQAPNTPQPPSVSPKQPTPSPAHQTPEPTIPITGPISVVRKGTNQGPMVQLYDPGDLTKVVRVIDGLFQATIDVPTASLTHIKSSAQHRTIYQGFRWHLIPRNDLSPQTPRDIGESVTTHQRRVGLIAKINPEGQVVKVYPLQKDAAEDNKLHKSQITSAIKYGTTTGGHLWHFWEDLDIETQAAYTASNTLPEAAANPRGLVVQRLDPKSKAVLETYPTIQAVYTKHNITAKTVKRVSETAETYNGFIWKLVQRE